MNARPTSLTMNMQINVLGEPLILCSSEPMTGFFRDGCCKVDASDRGSHVVCAIMTQEFLDFSRRMGNDLVSPRPEFHFYGLKPGDKWCVCALRWLEALQAGIVAPIVLEATHEKILDYVSLETLVLHQIN